MDQTTPLQILSAALNATALIFRAVLTTARVVLSLCLWPFVRIVWVLEGVFSPVLYTLSYIFSWVPGFGTVVAIVKPLYIFFGSAAFIGLIAGALLSLTALLLTTSLDLWREPPRKRIPSSLTPSRSSSSSIERKRDFDIDDYSASLLYDSDSDSTFHATPSGSVSGSASSRIVPRAGFSPFRRKVGGLLAQTILEESDS